jgi:hypothetical protein
MVIRVFDTLGRMTDRPAIVLYLGDVVRLKRAHPCGGDTWLVDRLGPTSASAAGPAIVMSSSIGGPWSASRRVRHARRSRAERRAAPRPTLS